MVKNKNIMLQKHKGSSLVLVIVMAAVLLILCTALETGVIWEANNARNQEKKTQAYYIARAGVVATAKYIESMSMSTFVPQLPLHSYDNIFANGTFNITVSKIDGNLEIESKGVVKNGKNSDGSEKNITDTVTVVLNNILTPTITTAIFGKSSIWLKGGHVYGDIGTNSLAANSIKYDNDIIEDHSDINGNTINSNIIIPYTLNSDTVVKKLANWIKSITVVVSTKDVVGNYPPPVMPSFPSDLTNMGNISINGDGSANISTDGYYDNIVIDSNTTLTINTSTGDRTIRIKNLDMQQGKIIITGGNKVNLYVDKCTKLKGYVNSDGNSNGDKSKLQLYCNNTTPFTMSGETHIYGSVTWGMGDLTFTGSGAIIGNLISLGTSVKFDGGSFLDSQILYAPNANIILTSGAQIKGAVIGNTVYMDGGASITLPTVLPTIPVNTDSYQISYWK